MSIDERELRSRLAETAALAGPPRFTTEDLAARVRRIRRRRRRRAGIIAAVSVAAVASAVAIPLTRGGTSQPVIMHPPPAAPELSYMVTVNGQTRAVPATGPAALPLFTITPGERLTMTVEVTVPAPRAMTALWLGITNGMLSSRPGGPADMKPILAASTRVPLRPGTHRFVLHWTVPAGLRPGTSRQLSVEWAWSGSEPGEAERIVAEFAVPLPSGASSPAAVARRLRSMVLHAARSCDGARPDWILAVRTTFSKAMAMAGGGDDIAGNATDAVYLVLMKGDFTLYNGGPAPSCAHAPTGHYFSAIIDAATFVTLEAGRGNRPLPVPLQTLGPVLNLT
ncbi:MAG TPA: hypothetical protein VE733_26035 [Streptosporangiaceae bacterium]|jgi:hypothetical protein|nr:hypothetical protein [Streptosporangiaceae bacterium]